MRCGRTRAVAVRAPAGAVTGAAVGAGCGWVPSAGAMFASAGSGPELSTAATGSGPLWQPEIPETPVRVARATARLNRDLWVNLLRISRILRVSSCWVNPYFVDEM